MGRSSGRQLNLCAPALCALALGGCRSPEVGHALHLLAAPRSPAGEQAWGYSRQPATSWVRGKTQSPTPPPPAEVIEPPPDR